MATAEQGTCAVKVSRCYWTVLLLLVCFALLRLTLFGNALELLVVTLPGGLALLGLWAPTLRVWHVGGSACWTAYCAFHISKLVSDPVWMRCL
jgi:hypothetical protein